MASVDDDPVTAEVDEGGSA
jgi:hypothetical protein